MKAISIKQPWASLVAIGKKTIEIRTWKTDYQGPLLIVSSKKIDRDYPANNLLEVLFEIPLGKALAVVSLIDCRLMRKEDEEVALCPFHPDLYAWILKDIRKIKKPFPVKGQLGIYDVDVRGLI